MEKDFMNYTGDPRAVLIHFNDKHDSNGRFAKKSGGASTRGTDKFIGPRNTDPILGVKPGEINIAKTWAKDVINKDDLDPQYGIDWMLSNIDQNSEAFDILAQDIGDGVMRAARAMVEYYVTESSSPMYQKFRDDNYHSPEEYLTGSVNLTNRIMADLADLYKDSAVITNYLNSDGGKKDVADEIGRALRDLYENNRPKATNKLKNKKHEKNVVDKTGSIDKKESVTLESIKKQYPKAPAAAINEIYKAKVEQQRKKKNASMRGTNKMPETAKHDSFMDYTGDPRAVLIHYNPNHNPKNGQFTSSPSVLMGRYIEIDEKTGKKKLTELGKARLEHDIKRNAQKKKDDQIKGTPDEIAAKLTDPHRWVTEDLNSAQQGLQNAQNMTKALKDFEQKKLDRRPKVRKKTLDLSQMTDQELNAQINRFLLEERYQDIFNPKVQPEVSKGKQWLMNTLEVAGGALAVGASAVTIAKAIHELKKGT